MESKHTRAHTRAQTAASAAKTSDGAQPCHIDGKRKHKRTSIFRVQGGLINRLMGKSTPRTQMSSPRVYHRHFPLMFTMQFRKALNKKTLALHNILSLNNDNALVLKCVVRAPNIHNNGEKYNTHVSSIFLHATFPLYYSVITSM